VRPPVNEGEAVLTTYLVILGSILVLGFLFVARQANRVLKRRGEARTEINLQGFRDDEFDEDIRDHAFSPNGNMLFPGFGEGFGEGIGGGRGRGRSRPEEVMVLRDIDLS
jgi:hypothetical protein